MEIMAGPISAGIELPTPSAHVSEVGSESSSSSSESSIGCPSGDEDENDEVETKIGGGLGSLGSFADLEDSLPIKRGLSNYFKGKSKSFANLSEVSNINDLEKQESPFNKRRRTLNACRLGRKSSFYTWYDPKSMPLLALNEEEDREDITEVNERKFRNFKSSSSCFSLADMNEQHA